VQFRRRCRRDSRRDSDRPVRIAGHDAHDVGRCDRGRGAARERVDRRAVGVRDTRDARVDRRPHQPRADDHGFAGGARVSDGHSRDRRRRGGRLRPGGRRRLAVCGRVGARKRRAHSAVHAHRSRDDGRARGTGGSEKPHPRSRQSQAAGRQSESSVDRVKGWPFHRALYGQVLIATVLGVVVGHFWPATGAAMKPLGAAFVKLVRMIVAPIIFCTVVGGIAGASGAKTVGKAGGLALIYFEVVTTLALVMGLVVVNVVKPGAGLNVDAAALDAKAVAQYVTASRDQSVTGFVLELIPTSVVDAFAKGDILQVLMFSVLFGFALRALHGSGRAVLDGLEKTSAVLFAVVAMIMKTAPLGAFGAMAFTIGSFGVGTLAQLAGLMACFYLTCVLFIAVVLGAIAWWHG